MKILLPEVCIAHIVFLRRIFWILECWSQNSLLTFRFTYLFWNHQVLWFPLTYVAHKAVFCGPGMHGLNELTDLLTPSMSSNLWPGERKANWVFGAAPTINHEMSSLSTFRRATNTLPSGWEISGRWAISSKWHCLSSVLILDSKCFRNSEDAVVCHL